MYCDSLFGEELTLPGSTIISPNYPNNYGINKDCQIKIRFLEGERVSIRVLAFDLEHDIACRYDWLEIRDGNSTTSDLLGSKLCGSTTPHAIESTENTLTLVFHTDGANVRSGFMLKVEIGTYEHRKQKYINNNSTE